MTDIPIYIDFVSDVVWLKNAIRRHALTLPPVFSDPLHYYLYDRLSILSSFVPKDSRFGRPTPYAVFWLAEAFHCSERTNIRKLALAVVYECLNVTITDDLADCDPESSRAVLASLAHKYSNMCSKLQRELFASRSIFWNVASECKAGVARYNEWNETCSKRTEPLSDDFLQESSRYVVSVSLPGLAGVAILAQKEEKIDEISRFLITYSMAWRIVDDISDWEKDLRVRNMNNSTILHWIFSKSGFKKMTRDVVLAMFLDEDFVNQIYGRVLDLLNKARQDSKRLDCAYLDEFMDSQIAYQTSQRDLLLDSKKSFQKDLTNLLLRASKSARKVRQRSSVSN
jgi:hypothetical protein